MNESKPTQVDLHECHNIHKTVCLHHCSDISVYLMSKKQRTQFLDVLTTS